MLQTRLQSIPLMALLSSKEQQQQLQQQQLLLAGGSSFGTTAGGSSSSASLTDAAAEQPLSPTFRKQPQPQRAPLIEERRLVQLFKSRVARLAGG